MDTLLYNISLRPDHDSDVLVSVPKGMGVPYYDSQSGQIRFRKRPESWQEALDMLHQNNGSEYEIVMNGISEMLFTDAKTADAFVALAKLKTLNRLWLADVDLVAPLTWGVKGLFRLGGGVDFLPFNLPNDPKFLVFPTKNMAVEFLDTFEDLFEKTKLIFK